MLPRIVLRLLLFLLGYAILRRSLVGLGLPNRPGSRGAMLPWLGMLVGLAVIVLVLRSCGMRL
jgi:hypothetical protein